MSPLQPTFFDREPALVARDLLGKLLLRRSSDGLTAGRIVETEAYLAKDDPASHSARGATPRNASMFGSPGRAYVYSIHAKWCFNIVTESIGVGSAVLVRALEPVFGLPLMQQRRSREKLLELTRGPARLCQALAIDRSFDGWDLSLGKRLWIADDDSGAVQSPIVATPRIGISQATGLLLRFCYAGNLFVSGPRSLGRGDDA